MDEEIERLIVAVRADTQGFARDIGTMRAELDGPFASGLDRAGRILEGGLNRAIQSGKFGFDDLRRVALSALAEIATAAVQSGVNGLFGGGNNTGAGGGGDSLVSSLGSLLGSALGAPGRATGGPVSPGRAYRVGERGPELFVPTSSGRIETGGGGGARSPINMTINVSDSGRNSAPDSLQRSSRHIARALRQVLARAED